jgi:hypothetical protein
MLFQCVDVSAKPCIMHNTSSTNVRSGSLRLWTFVVYGITLLLFVLSTRWYYKEDSTITVKTMLAADSTIQQSNLALKHVGSQLNNLIDSKLYDRYHREDALLWKPKFDSVRILTEKILEVIETKEIRLKSNKPPSEVINLKAELCSSLWHYYTAIMRLIPMEKQKEINELPIQSLLGLMNETSISNIFQTTNPINQSILLSKIKNDVILSNNIILNFCVQQCSRLILICGGPYPIITQNTTCLKAGEKLQITAGLVSYDNYFQTTITINNKKVPLTEDGNAVYWIKVKNRKNNIIPVSVSYKDPNTGELKKISTNVTFTVFEPSKN